jgi:AcrR family transcriptional regulator
MSAVTLQEARQAVVRERVLDGVAALLRAGQELTFAKVAVAAGVPERTVYRYFPTREALLTAVYEWANRHTGLEGQRPATGEEAVSLVRRSFPAFDHLAPIVRTLLLAPEGLAARLSTNEERRRAAVEVVRHEAPHLDERSTVRLAAVIQLLSSAAAWQALHDYWDFDGDEAAETSAFGIDLLLTATRGRSRKASPRATGAKR